MLRKRQSLSSSHARKRAIQYLLAFIAGTASINRDAGYWMPALARHDRLVIQLLLRLS
jgi:hypothetical protein